MPVLVSRQCSNCTRFDGALDADPPDDQKGVEVFGCAAFPRGIPDAILEERFDHRAAFEGDGGILFDQRPDGENVAEIFGEGG